MSKRTLSKEEQEKILANSNVQYCSDKSITYTKDFKLSAIQQYDQGLSSTEIFRQAELNLNLIGRDTPKSCLRRWRKIHKEKGSRGLSEVRGKNVSGRPKKHKRSKDERLKYLEAEVQYLKEENAFLAQLRAKKME